MNRSLGIAKSDSTGNLIGLEGSGGEPTPAVRRHSHFVISGSQRARLEAEAAARYHQQQLKERARQRLASYGGLASALKLDPVNRGSTHESFSRDHSSDSDRSKSGSRPRHRGEDSPSPQHTSFRRHYGSVEDLSRAQYHQQQQRQYELYSTCGSLGGQRGETLGWDCLTPPPSSPDASLTVLTDSVRSPSRNESAAMSWSRTARPATTPLALQRTPLPSAANSTPRVAGASRSGSTTVAPVPWSAAALTVPPMLTPVQAGGDPQAVEGVGETTASYRPPSPPRHHPSRSANASSDALDALGGSGSGSDVRRVQFAIPSLRRSAARRVSGGPGLPPAPPQQQQQQQPSHVKAAAPPTSATASGSPLTSAQAVGVRGEGSVSVSRASASPHSPLTEDSRPTAALASSLDRVGRVSQGERRSPPPRPAVTADAVVPPNTLSSSTANGMPAGAAGKPSEPPPLSLQLRREGNRSVLKVTPTPAPTLTPLSSTSGSAGANAASGLAIYSPKMHPLKPALRQSSRYSSAGAGGESEEARRPPTRVMAAERRLDPRIARGLHEAYRGLVNTHIAKHAALALLLTLGLVLVLLV